MAKQKKVREVVKHPDGWAVKRPGASRAATVHPTQKEAVRRAREIVGKQGGGEVVIHGRSGRIQIREVRGLDPNPSGGVSRSRAPSPPKGGKRATGGKSVTKIRKIGSSQGVILNREILESSGLKEGDRVFVLSTPDGVKLTPYDPAFVEVIESNRDYMRRHRNALRELAK